MEKGKIIGIHDHEGHIAFTFAKDPSFLAGFEQFLHDSEIKCDKLFDSKAIDSIIDKVYHFASNSFTLYIFFGEEKIIVVLTAYTRKGLLETKQDLLRYFEFEGRVLDHDKAEMTR
jgi:hypothetical protein